MQDVEFYDLVLEVVVVEVVVLLVVESAPKEVVTQCSHLEP